MSTSNRWEWRRVVRLVATVYAVGLIALTMLPLGTYPYPPPNPYPFDTIGQLFGRDGLHVSVLRLMVGNVLAFVPLGILTPLLAPNRRSWLFVLAVGLVVSVAIELSQLGLSGVVGYTYRQSDVDDVILNVVGALLGYVAFTIFHGRFDGPAERSG
jgi:glycopeptide antibiotics resistance protein